MAELLSPPTNTSSYFQYLPQMHLPSQLITALISFPNIGVLLKLSPVLVVID